MKTGIVSAFTLALMMCAGCGKNEDLGAVEALAMEHGAAACATLQAALGELFAASSSDKPEFLPVGSEPLSAQFVKVDGRTQARVTVQVRPFAGGRTFDLVLVYVKSGSRWVLDGVQMAHGSRAARDEARMKPTDPPRPKKSSDDDDDDDDDDDEDSVSEKAVNALKAILP